METGVGGERYDDLICDEESNIREASQCRMDHPGGLIPDKKLLYPPMSLDHIIVVIYAR